MKCLSNLTVKVSLSVNILKYNVRRGLSYLGNIILEDSLTGLENFKLFYLILFIFIVLMLIINMIIFARLVNTLLLKDVR